MLEHKVLFVALVALRISLNGIQTVQKQRKELRYECMDLEQSTLKSLVTTASIFQVEH